jgi:SAM-dependent methyltransferase
MEAMTPPLYRAELALKRRLATPMLRRLLGRPLCARERLARAYLQGNGVEIGALNSPLKVSEHAHVRYADYLPNDALHAGFPDLPTIQSPDVISDLESMRGFADASLDFVIANHVLEHVEDPLRALRSISRVLRRGGPAFIALPDKRRTFDKRREVTSLAHIQRDFIEGPEWSRREHYIDWARNVDRSRNAAEQAAGMEAARANIHFHAWDFRAMKEMFCYAQKFNLSVVEAQRNRDEVIWILRKR